MGTQDNCCSIAPYFKIHDGRIEAFKELCEKFVEAASSEPKCLYYGFSFDGDVAYCREGYEGAEGVLMHVQNAGPLLGEALKISDLTRMEIHGPEKELAKLREPLADLNQTFFTLEYGFRR